MTRIYWWWLAGAKSRIEARKSRSEKGQEVVKTELWQGAASQQQKF